MVEKGRMSEEDMVAALARIKPTHDIADMADCDLVIEAVAEDLEIKKPLFAELAETLKPEAILSTATSSLPVIECAMVTDRPDQVVGLHFFNPAAIMKLVEIVPTVRTDDAVVEQAGRSSTKVGKVGVLCGDRAGFIVNALLFPYLNDAVKMLESHYATAEEIDTAMKLGAGYPMGPFQLADIVGLDVTLAIIETLHRSSASRPSSRRPCCATWSRPGSSAARRGAGSTPTADRAGHRRHARRPDRSGLPRP
jgi:3-hydroxybutyryl-CoA dehydrogenase